jgi:hypothetical protein
MQPGYEPAAVKRRHGSEECEGWNRNDQGYDPRQNQHLYRVEAHCAQRIDFLRMRIAPSSAV